MALEAPVACGEPSDGPRVVALTVKVSRATVRAVDAARGSVPRSEWLEQAVRLFLVHGAVLVSVAGSGEQAVAVAGAVAALERARGAQGVPVPRLCPHGRRGGYCVPCRVMVDVEGFPVKPP